jgi:hypothetical protein
MPPTRSRTAGLAVAVSLSFTLGFPAGPVVAAGSPVEVVEELITAVEDGRYEAVDTLVCEAERASVREMLEPAAAMDVDTAALVDSITFTVSDRAVELVAEDGDEATVRLTGEMAMDLGGADPEELARAMLADSLGEEPTDEDIETWLPLVTMSFTQSFPLDEEITLVQEGGDWVICGGLGVPADETDGSEPSVSEEGLCGLVAPAELNGLSQLSYDSSSGFGPYCTYSNSDYDAFHSASVSVEFNADAEYLAQAYGADEPIEVAGRSAWATGPDGYGANLVSQAGDDVLLVSVALPEDAPDDLDWLTQATRVTELFLPLMEEARILLVGPTPAPTPEPTPEISLCETLPLAEINELTGLGLDEAEGDPLYCNYTSSDGEPGYHVATVTIIEMPLDEYAAWLPDPVETSVGDLRAVAATGSLLVELPGGTHTLMVGGFVDPADEGAELTQEDLLSLLAERLAPAIDVPAPTVPAGQDFDLQGLEALIDENDGSSDELEPLPRPMCEYFDLDAVNRLGIIEVDVANSFFDGHCWLTSSDLMDGRGEVSAILDGLTIDDVRDWYEDGLDLTVAGRPAFAGDVDLRVETSAGGVNFSATLPEEALEAGWVASDVTIPLAELVVAAIEADLAE